MNRDLLLLIHLMKANQKQMGQLPVVSVNKHPLLYKASSKAAIKQNVASALREMANLLDPIAVSSKQINM